MATIHSAETRKHDLTVAGTFFPGEPAALRQALETAAAKAQPPYNRPWCALIAPHAGYRFSGSIAASAYRSTRAISETCKRVILLSPAHRYRFDGLALPERNNIQLLEGALQIDRIARNMALTVSGTEVLGEAFENEHGIETQLPFIQEYLPHAAVLPVVVGRTDVDPVAQLIRKFAGQPDTLIVISTDLSHFHSLKQATRIDAQTCQQIERLDGSALTSANACGVLPLRGLLAVAADAGWRVTRLDQATSAAAGGNPERVVGYCAYGLEPFAGARLADEERRTLLRIAMRSIECAIKTSKVPAVRLHKVSHPLATLRRTFVTLTKDGKLRGCIGSLEAHHPLAQSIARHAALAAIGDKRFKPMQTADLRPLDIEISILSAEERMGCTSEDELLQQLRPGHDGLTLRSAKHRATFLPKVWAKMPDPATFVRALKQKAGLDPEDWPTDLTCWRYSAESFRTSLSR